MKSIFKVMAVAAVTGLAVMADQITLGDGSVLKGKITEIFDGKVKITTEYAGSLVIDRAKVSAIVTDGPVMVALPTGKQEAKLGEKDGKITVGTDYVEPSAIQAVWKLGGVDPTLPKPRKWAYQADFSLDGKTGNTEKNNIGGGIKATLEGPEDKLVLALRGKYGRENGVKNEEEIIGTADYERMISDTNNSFYVRGKMEKDEFENYDLYTTIGAGYGYYLVKNADYQIRLRAGAVYQNIKYDEGMDDDDNVAADFNYHHEIKIHKFLGFKEFGKLVTDVTYTPTLDDWMNDYTISHESAIDIPLGGSPNWAIRLGVSNEYKSRTARGVEHLDTTYFARLLLNWN